MHKSNQHTRIFSLPVPEPVSAGQLDSYAIEGHNTHPDLVLDYHALVPDRPSMLFKRGKQILERTQGIYQPRRLRFLAVRKLEISGPYENLENLPSGHSARTIMDIFTWRAIGEDLPFFLLFGRSQEDAEIRFYARGVKREERNGKSNPFKYERDWSPAPPMPARLVPSPRTIHQRFGGDPVDIILNSKRYHLRLFVGGLEIQPSNRPDVDAVLNLGENPGTWVTGDQVPASDRWEKKGEGSQGMTVELILKEAEWVIDRLQDGQRVLVHCVAGMNRSATIACAVLILLEGLTAEAALERVREHHPWARPDSHHWLALKWLASGKA